MDFTNASSQLHSILKDELNFYNMGENIKKEDDTLDLDKIDLKSL